jgi:hypothetical protein
MVAAGTIAGLGDEHTAVPMATLMIAGAAASMIGFVLAKPAASHADQQTPARSVGVRPHVSLGVRPDVSVSAW